MPLSNEVELIKSVGNFIGLQVEWSVATKMFPILALALPCIYALSHLHFSPRCSAKSGRSKDESIGGEVK